MKLIKLILLKLIGIILKFSIRRNPHDLLNIIVNIWSSENSEYLTWKARPMFSFQLDSKSIKNDISPFSTALIIQGPIIKDDYFTLNTVMFYKNIFPKCHIILSTWDDYDCIEFEEFCTVIKSNKPDKPGMSNINYQLISTSNGLKKARELNCKYVLKTRTDQRIYSKDIDTYFKNLLKTNLYSGQKLIILNFNTFKFRLYTPSDMLMFGEIDEMMLFWSNLIYSEKSHKKLESQILNSKITCPESYLFLSFLIKKNEKIFWNLNHSIMLIVKYFIIVDKNTVDLFWPKYSNEEDRWKNYKINSIHEEINFLEWLYFNNNPINIDAIIPENIVENPVKIFNE